MPEMGPIAPWIGITVTLLIGIFNFCRTTKSNRSANFERAFGIELETVVQHLREVRSECDRVLRTASSVDNGRDIIHSSVDTHIRAAQNTLTQDVSRLGESPLPKYKTEWMNLARSESWDAMWTAVSSVRTATNMADFVVATKEIRAIAVSLHDQILSLRDRENA
jgi:hypothetical protein